MKLPKRYRPHLCCSKDPERASDAAEDALRDAILDALEAKDREIEAAKKNADTAEAALEMGRFRLWLWTERAVSAEEKRDEARAEMERLTRGLVTE